MNVHSMRAILALAIFFPISISYAEQTTSEQIQQLYIGYLGRAADPAGLEYWTGQVEGGLITIDQIRVNLVNEQPEYQENYGVLSNSDLVVAIYLGLFNREPDEAGRLYWEDQLNLGLVLPDQLIIAFINGAFPDDRAILDNKLTAAACYTSNPEFYSADLVARIITELDKSEAYTQCPPVADAGADQSVNSEDLVELDGSGADLESGVTLMWSQLSGPAVELSDNSVANANFIAPSVESGSTESVELQLTAIDGSGAAGTDNVLINVTGITPIDAFSFYQASISDQIIQGRCINCHIQGGLASGSALRYQRDSVAGYQITNFNLLDDYVDTGNSETLLSKPRGVGHGGGVQLSATSESYQNWQTFVEMLMSN